MKKVIKMAAEPKVLNDSQMRELSQLFTKNNAVSELMFYAQFAFYIKGVTRKEIIDGVMSKFNIKNFHLPQKKNASIKDYHKKKRSPPNMSMKTVIEREKKISLNTISQKDFEEIIDQIFQHTKHQPQEFYNYLSFRYVQSGGTKFRDLTDFLRYLIMETDKTLKLSLDQENRVIVPMECMKMLEEAEKSIQDHKYFKKRYKIFAILWIFACIYNSYSEVAEHGFVINQSQICNMLLFLLFCGVYFYGDRWAKFSASLDKEEFASLPFPEYRLEEVKIVNQNTPTSLLKSTFLPRLNYTTATEEPFIEETRSEKTEIRTKKKSVSSQDQPSQSSSTSTANVPKPISHPDLSWSGSSVWFYNETRLPCANTHPMSDFFPRNIRYFGFFNQESLRKQGLTPEDVEWKHYEARVQKGTVVRHEGSTGIKSLNPRILSRIKIAGHDFGFTLFSWSAKTVKTEYRLLGRNAATEVSRDGVQHHLVDFCSHWTKGPGH